MNFQPFLCRKVKAPSNIKKLLKYHTQFVLCLCSTAKIAQGNGIPTEREKSKDNDLQKQNFIDYTVFPVRKETIACEVQQEKITEKNSNESKESDYRNRVTNSTYVHVYLQCIYI